LRAVKPAASRTFALSCAALTLAAFALRSADLTGRGFWLDESFTLLRIEGAWTDLFANRVWRQGIDTVDLNPQLYFALLKLWSGLAGLGDWSLRLFSVGWAVLCVLLTAVLGARAHSRRVGLLAAVFALTCPALQWYGWELRNYSIAAALAACNGYVALRIARPRAGDRAARLIAVWVISAAAGLFAHYTFAGWIAGQLAFAAVAVVRGRGIAVRLPSALWVAASGAAVIAVVALSGLGASLVRAYAVHVAPRLASPEGGFVSPLALLLEVAGPMQFGFNAADPLDGALNVALLALASCGLWAARRALGTLAAAALATLAMWWALSLFLSNRPSFRYFITLVPMLYVAAACGVAWLARMPRGRGLSALAAVASSLLVLGPHAHGLVQSFARTPTHQDDWRALARDLRDNWQPGDVLVINLNTPEAVLRRELVDLPLDMHAFAALNRAYDAGQLTPEAFRARYRRIWFADTGANDYSAADVARWFVPEQPVRARVYAGRTTIPALKLYPLRAGLSTVLPEGQVTVEAPSTAPTALIGWRVIEGSAHRRDSTIRLRASWLRASPGAGAVDVRLRLERGDAALYDVALTNALETAPPSWGVGDNAVFTTDHEVPMPPGFHQSGLRMRVEAWVDGVVAQQQARALDDEELAVIHALPEPELAPLLSAPDVELVRAEFPEAVRVGQVLPVVLSWRRLTTDAQPWDSVLELKPAIGAAVTRAQMPTGVDPDPIDAWPLRRWVRASASLALNASVTPGTYVLVVTRMRAGVAVDSATLGNVRVERYPRSPIPTDATRRVEATAGELTLLGVKIPPLTRGGTFDIRTHWRVDRAPTRDGVITLRLFYPDGTPGPQDDNKPERGARSTLSYNPGDGIDLSHRIVLPADAPSGDYTVVVGVYDSEGGLRWPASKDGVLARDDLIVVGTVRVP
jgi:hypothetical protein